MSRCAVARSSAPAPIERPFSMYLAPAIDSGALAASVAGNVRRGCDRVVMDLVDQSDRIACTARKRSAE